MTFFITAISADGQKFKIFENGTWEQDNKITSEKRTFRSSCWGDSAEKIKATETTEPEFDTHDLLGYNTDIAGLSALAVYHLINGHLVMGRYSITEPHAEDNAYLSDFENIKNLLKKKYGPSDGSKTYWINDLYKDDYERWGMAVSCGHLSCFEIWDMEDTHIELQLNGDNYKIELFIIYYSKSRKHLIDSHVEQAQLENL